MQQYVIKRLLLVVPTLLLVSVIVFSLTRLIPGDVVVLMFEEKALCGRFGGSAGQAWAQPADLRAVWDLA